MKLRNLFLFSIIALLGFTSIYAQNYTIRTSIDSTSIKVGDPIHIRFEISAPNNIRVLIPSFGDSLSKGVEVLKKIQVDSANKSNRQWVMEVTSYDSGKQVIPSLPFVFISGNKNDTLFSDSLKINVSLLPTDSTKVLADIKQPVNVPLTFKEVLPFLIWGVGGLLFIILIVWLIYRLRSKKSILPNFKKIEPAHVRALRNLQSLKDEKLWQNGFVKEYYTRMSDIVRLYLEERFAIQALEQTTSEIIKELEQSNQIVSYKQEIVEILEMSDLAKFAKVHPEEKENVRCLEMAVAFVQNTIPSTNDVENKDDNTLID